MSGSANTTRGAPHRGGPVEDAIGLDASYVLKPGRGFVDYPIVLRNKAKSAARVTGIRLTRSRGLRLRKALGAGTDRGTGALPFDAIPSSKLHPLVGMTLPARPSPVSFEWKQGIEVFLKLRVPRRVGRYGYSGFRIDYTISGERYQDRIPHQVVICVTRKKDANCRLDPAAT